MQCTSCGVEQSKKWVKGLCSVCYHRQYNKRYFADPDVRAKQRVREAFSSSRLRRRSDPKWKLSRRVRKYGLTPSVYEEMLEKQGGSCAICRHSFDDTARGKPRIDHCHVTGRVRGLLCDGCNAGIGMLGDTAKAIIDAAEYLVRFEEGSRSPTT